MARETEPGERPTVPTANRGSEELRPEPAFAEGVRVDGLAGAVAGAQAVAAATRRAVQALSPALYGFQQAVATACAPWARMLAELDLAPWLKELAAVAQKARDGLVLFEQTLPLAGALGAHGWTVPLHASPRELVELLTKATDPDSADAAFIEFFEKRGGQNRKALIEALLAHPRMGRWHSLLDEVAFSVSSGKYRVAVSALLPILEGVAHDELGTFLSSDGRRCRFFEKKVKSLPADDWDRHFWTGVAAFTEVLYRTAKRTKPLSLNRNWILHGRGAPDGSHADCLRVLQAIHTVLELCSAQKPAAS